MKAYGKKVWLIADCYLPKDYVNKISHEAVCVLNTGDKDAEITMTAFYEDMPPVENIASFCKAKKTHHIRLDKIILPDGGKLRTDTPFALLVVSDTDVIVQHTRMDTSMGNMALMTTMAYAAEN